MEWQPDAMKVTLTIFTAVSFLLVAQSAAPGFAELNDIESEFDSPEILGKDTDLLLYYAIFNSSLLDPDTISEITEAQPCLDAASEENLETLGFIKMRGAKMRECMVVKEDHMLEYFGTYGTSGEIFKEHFIQTVQEDCSHRSLRSSILDCYADAIATHLNKVSTDNYEIYSQYYWGSKFCIRSELYYLVENFIQESSGLLRCLVLLNEFPKNSSLNTVDYSDPQLPYPNYPDHETPTTHKPHKKKKSWWDHIVSFWNWIWG